MSEFEYLGEELRQQLHGVVADVTPSAELMAQVDAIPSAHRSGVRKAFERLSPRRLALAVPLPVAAIVAGVVLLFGGGAAPSSAGLVTVLPNGEVRLDPTELSNAVVANAILRRHHIHNIVVVPMDASCKDRDWTYIAGTARPASKTLLTPRTGSAAYVSVIAAKQVAADEILTAINRFRGRRLPTCASTRGWGIAMGGFPHYPPPKGQTG